MSEYLKMLRFGICITYVSTSSIFFTNHLNKGWAQKSQMEINNAVLFTPDH